MTILINILCKLSTQKELNQCIPNLNIYIDTNMQVEKRAKLQEDQEVQRTPFAGADAPTPASTTNNKD